MRDIISDFGGLKNISQALARSYDASKEHLLLTVEGFLSVIWWQRLRKDSFHKATVADAGLLAIQIAVFSPSSAEAERMYSLLKMFNHLRLKSLQDQIEAGTLMRYNAAQSRRQKSRREIWFKAECQRKIRKHNESTQVITLADNNGADAEVVPPAEVMHPAEVVRPAAVVPPVEVVPPAAVVPPVEVVPPAEVVPPVEVVSPVVSAAYAEV